MIANSSRTGEIIYDPFLGSGGTLVSAHQLGRIGYGVEISPEYVAVSLQRLADPGLEPKLIDG
jgi:site-specific DNA-methyltransferase (adenine-specific)